MDKIVSVTVVLADEDDFAGMNEEWLKWFPSNPPARQGAWPDIVIHSAFVISYLALAGAAWRGPARERS